MKNLLQIAAIQTHLVWEDISTNLQTFTKHIEESCKDVDLVVLPEMFATGFTMNPKPVAESMDGLSVSWMKEIAAKNNMAVVGSLVIKEDESYFNRSVFVYPDGTIKTYNKRHSFTLSGEHKAYKAGVEKIIIEYKGWKICPLICYDLRFPVWSRNVEDYDLLLYMANWPKPRITAWDALLKARAIENMSYVVGVNRIGEDENGYEFSGHSTIVDHLGTELCNSTANKEMVLKATLDKEAMLKTRKKLNFLNDKDLFTIKK